MTAFSVAINSDGSTDANFRAWITILTNIIASAWVQTSDTGQINLATVVHPTITGANQGYQIWRMNDSLQSTTPCYLKLEYGASTIGAYYPGIWISVGTGTDGAGNLLGSNGIRVFQYSSTANTTGTLKGSIDTNRMCLYIFYGNTSSQMLFCVERTHNTAGADTSAGILCFTSGYGANSSFAIIPGITTTNNLYWNVVMPPNLTTNAWSANVYTFPVRTWGQGETSPSTQLLTYYTGDITVLNPIPITTWEGVSRTFLPVGVNYNSVGYGPATTQQSVAIRYE